MATITIPNLEELAERIRACRDELKALRKLQRIAKAERDAREAKERRSKPLESLGVAS